MKTFQEWLNENRYRDTYPPAYGGGNIEKLGKSRASGLSYGGRSLANWSAVNANRDKIKKEMSVDQLSRDENGVRMFNADFVEEIQRLLDRNNLTVSKEAPNRLAVLDDEGNVVFHSSSWPDVEKTLVRTYGRGDESDWLHNSSSVRQDARSRLERKDRS